MKRIKKLYLLSQEANSNYDTYDSAVVVATSVDKARLIQPPHEPCSEMSTWTTPENVNVKYLGIASTRLKNNCIICSSFNAG